mmetsp:Transcript_21008/g.35365  ORF Transcript_21008/g.35365 Transcript_21008/m.35365 type:complete len:114 (+) Transcript_21008:624-965(+)
MSAGACPPTPASGSMNPGECCSLPSSARITPAVAAAAAAMGMAMGAKRKAMKVVVTITVEVAVAAAGQMMRKKGGLKVKELAIFFARLSTKQPPFSSSGTDVPVSNQRHKASV